MGEEMRHALHHFFVVAHPLRRRRNVEDGTMTESNQQGNGDVATGTGEDQSRRSRPTSTKQIEANRRNAMLSTGPRTPAGKRASRQNALKHGLRAQEIVLSGREDPAEFEQLFADQCDESMPVGGKEIYHVRERAIAEWRLRRCRRAELALIRSREIGEALTDPEEEIQRARDLFPGTLPTVLRKSAVGINHLIDQVTLAVVELEETGAISRETCDELDFVFGEEQGNFALILRARFHNEAPEWLRRRMRLCEKADPGSDRNPVDRQAVAHKELEHCLQEL
jgi:hypothetical protein